MRIKIGTDSTADIPQEVRERLDINVLPLSVVHEGREYVECVDINPEEFYVTLENCEKIPTSSQVTTQAYVDFYEKTFAAGYTDLIQISLNAKGSGTFQSGVVAKDLFFEAHPEAAGKFTIHNVDSETYSMLYGHAVIKAAEMARNGASVEEIIAKVERMVKAVRGVFVPLTLRFVKKSGRVSAAAAFLGDAMGLKPVITFENGESKIISKIRGEKHVVSELCDLCEKERASGTPYVLIRGNNEKMNEEMREAFVAAFGQPEYEYNIGCIIAMNTGPDMVGMVYYRDEI